MGRYFTTIITAYVVSSSLHSCSGLTPCRWPAFQSCRDPSAPSEHHFSSYVPLITFSFPKSTLGKRKKKEKAAPLDYIWDKMYHRWGFVQPKNTLFPKAHCRLVTGFKPLFLSEEKTWFLTGVNQQSSVNLHWSTLNRVGSSHSNRQNHFITENLIKTAGTSRRTGQKRALLLLKSLPFLYLQSLSKVSLICQKYTKKSI